MDAVTPVSLRLPDGGAEAPVSRPVVLLSSAPSSADHAAAVVTGKVIPAVTHELIETIRTRSLKGVEVPVVQIEETSMEDNPRMRRRAVVSAAGFIPGGGGQALGLSAGVVHDRRFWLDFFSDLRSRGLRGVRVVVAPSFRGLPEAVRAVFPSALWIRPEEIAAALGDGEIGPWWSELLATPDQPDPAS